MPVVINEFEIVPAAEPPKASGTAAGTDKPPAASSATTSQEIERVLCRIRDRAMRLRAH